MIEPELKGKPIVFTKNNSEALDFFNSSKILINQHEPYLERLVTILVLEDKVPQAINFIRINSEKSNSQFFEAYILLALDLLRLNDYLSSFMFN